jgi:hypothetical protein
VFRFVWCCLRSPVSGCRARGRCGGFQDRGLLLRGYRGTVWDCIVRFIVFYLDGLFGARGCTVLTSVGRTLSGANASWRSVRSLIRFFAFRVWHCLRSWQARSVRALVSW